MARTQPLYIGIGGHVVSIDRTTGAEIWRTKLKTTQFVTVAADKGCVYAGAGGELFCIDATTGSIRWHNKLKGLGMGVIAFDGASSPAIMAAIAAAQAAASAAT